MGLAAAAAFAVAPRASHAAAACGDVNNDGSFTVADCIIISQCANGSCPTPPAGGFCGTGNLATCGDLFKDGDVTPTGLISDLAVCQANQAGLSTLYDPCDGPTPAKVIACPGGTVTIPAGTITTGQTWPKACTVKLGGTVLVGTGAPGTPTTVLRVEKGSVVQGVTGSINPALIFLPGTHIDAQGTQAEPIVFTSSQANGAKTKGSWGGIMFNGKSTVNGPNCQGQSEGVPEPFGGCVANDSSGIMSFVRSEFAGIVFTPDNELNSITMNAIGSQTQFNFMQGHQGNDDCIEWFGGTSNHKHLVASSCADDGLDYQLGFTGSVQYAFLFQNGSGTDAGSRDDRCIEADNSEFDNSALPFSDPDFCNVTCIGAKNAGPEFTDNGGSDSGLMLRRGTRGQFANLITTGFQDSGLELRDVKTSTEACVDADANGIPESLTGKLIVRNSVFFDNGTSCSTAGGEQAKNGDDLDCGSAGCSSPNTCTIDACGTNAACTAATTPFACCTGPGTGTCSRSGCACDSESFYDQLVTSFNVVPGLNQNSVNPGVSTAYPPQNNVLCLAAGNPWSCCSGAGSGTCNTNSACTGAGVPYTCCTGAGAGTCRALPDLRPGNVQCTAAGAPSACCTGPGTGTCLTGAPSAFTCKTINPLFDNVSYLGGVNPGTAYAATSYDWLSKPWLEFAVQ
jgi:hypothetical protein